MPKIHISTADTVTKRKKVSPISAREVRDIEFTRGVFQLAYRISRELGLDPAEWREFLLFLAWYVEEFGIDTEHLEKVANLNALEFEGDDDAFPATENATDDFERRWKDWARKRLCRKPLQFTGGYVNKRTRPWFITTATILKSAFPEVVHRNPRRSSHRTKTTLATLKEAWHADKERKRRTRVWGGKRRKKEARKRP